MTKVKRKQLKEKYGNEHVMVVKDKDIPATLQTQGFIYAPERVIDFIEQNSEFILRYNAEYNPDYRQPIPYVLINVKDKYFATQRLAGSGEARLVEQISLGVGGHINPEDVIVKGVGDNTVENAVWREINEEIILPKCGIDIEFIGIINDMNNSVSRDHLGLLFIAKLFLEDGQEVKVKEVDKLKGIYCSSGELKESKDRLESWSQIVYDEVLANWGVNP